MLVVGYDSKQVNKMILADRAHFRQRQQQLPASKSRGAKAPLCTSCAAAEGNDGLDEPFN